MLYFLLYFIDKFSYIISAVAFIEDRVKVVKIISYGGDRSGMIIARSTPEEVAQAEGSYTGEYLNQVL